MGIPKTLGIICILMSLMTPKAIGTERDKLLHFSVSTAISSGVYLHTKRVKPALRVCVAIGLAKESLDALDPKNHKGFDTKDMVANLLGCYVGIRLVESIFTLDVSKNTIRLKAKWRF